MRWRWRLSRRLGSLRLRSTSKASSGPEVSSSQSSSHWSSTEAPSSPAPYSSSTRVLSSSFASHQLSTGVPSSFSIHSSSTKIPPSPPEHDHSVSSSDMQNLSPSSSYTLIRHQPSLVNSSDNNTTNNSGDTDDTENSSASTGSSTGNHTRDARDSIVSATRSSSDLDCSAYEAYVLASPGGWSPSVPRRPITPPQQVDHSNRKNFRQDVRVFRFPKEEGDMYQMPGEVSAFEEILLTRGFTTHREYFVDEEMRRVLRERVGFPPLQPVAFRCDLLIPHFSWIRDSPLR